MRASRIDRRRIGMRLLPGRRARLVGFIMLAGLSSHAMARGGAVQTLTLGDSFDPAAVGALDPGNADLSPALWQGADRAEMSRLIAGLPSRISSPTLADLARRALAIAAAPPQGPRIAPGFTETRAETLLRMGQAVLAARMLAGMPKASRTESTNALLLNASLMAGDNAGACAVAQSLATSAKAVLFAKVHTVCEALAGDAARAELGATLLAERAPDDAAFFELLDMMLGATDKPGPAVKALKRPSPLHLAMMRAIGIAPKQLLPLASEGLKAAAPSIHVAMDRLIASDPAATPVLRLAAAWRVLKAGAGDMDATRQLFLAVGADAPKASVARSYSAAASVESGPSRALALARFLMAADAEGGSGAHGVAAELAHPMLRNLLAVASGPDIALRVARGLLFTGESAVAIRWLRSLEGAAKVPGALDGSARLAVLISLADGQDVRTFDGPRAVLWLGAHTRLDPETAAEKAAVLGQLRKAVGLEAPLALGGAALGGATAGLPPLMVLPLQEAAADGKIGEAVLRAIHLVEVEQAGSRARRLAAAAAALSEVGLYEAARFLALEAAIEADL